MTYYYYGVDILRLQNLLQSVGSAAVPSRFLKSDILLVNGKVGGYLYARGAGRKRTKAFYKLGERSVFGQFRLGGFEEETRKDSEWPRILFMDRIVPARTARNECLSCRSVLDGFNENAHQIQIEDAVIFAEV